MKEEKKGDAGNGYQANVDLIMKETSLDRPAKTLQQENIELKSAIFKMHERIYGLKHLIMKYTTLSDDSSGPA
jgi:hypothetical protein